jgi:hypothetical protein
MRFVRGMTNKPCLTILGRVRRMSISALEAEIGPVGLLLGQQLDNGQSNGWMAP